MEIAVKIYYPTLLAIGAVVSWYTVILYARTQKSWWNPVSQVVLVMSASLGAVFTWVFLIRIWPTIPGRTVTGMVLFTLVVCAMVWKAYVLTKLFRIIKREKVNGPSQKD